MKVFVITGGIGSGKTSACRFLEKEFGWPVYYADERVKALYMDSPGLLDKIETSLCGRFRDEDGRFVPSLLASVIFGNREALEKVEAIVFPELTADFDRWKAEHHDCDHVILESATILEKPSLSRLGDITVLIDAPVGQRAARAALRDGAPKESIMRRMDNQQLMNSISNGQATVAVDSVIMNDSTEEDFHAKLRTWAENIL